MQKETEDLNVFALLGSSPVKAAHKYAGEINPGKLGKQIQQARQNFLTLRSSKLGSE